MKGESATLVGVILQNKGAIVKMNRWGKKKKSTGVCMEGVFLNGT